MMQGSPLWPTMPITSMNNSTLLLCFLVSLTHSIILFREHNISLGNRFPAEVSNHPSEVLVFVFRSFFFLARKGCGEASLFARQTFRMSKMSPRPVVPELYRLHVLLPKPLELGGHGLIAVPESLPVLLCRLRLGDLDP